MSDELAAATRAEEVVDALGVDEGALIEAKTDVSDWQEVYGNREAFACLVRTILSQNTSDSASQPAHEMLLDNYDSREADLAESLAVQTSKRLQRRFAPPASTTRRPRKSSVLPSGSSRSTARQRRSTSS